MAIEKYGRRLLFVLTLILVSTSLAKSLRAEGLDGNGANVIVAYASGASPQDIQEIEKKYGLDLVKTLAAASSRVYRVSSTTSLERTLRDLGTEKMVRYAEIDQDVTIKEEQRK